MCGAVLQGFPNTAPQVTPSPGCAYAVGGNKQEQSPWSLILSPAKFTDGFISFEGQGYLGLCFFINKINIIILQAQLMLPPWSTWKWRVLSVDFTEGRVDFLFVINTFRVLVALDVDFWNSLVVLLCVTGTCICLKAVHIVCLVDLI